MELWMIVNFVSQIIKFCLIFCLFFNFIFKHHGYLLCRKKLHFFSQGFSWLSYNVQQPPPVCTFYCPHFPSSYPLWCLFPPSHPPTHQRPSSPLLWDRHFIFLSLFLSLPMSLLAIVVCITVNEGVPCMSFYPPCPNWSFPTITFIIEPSLL